MCNFLIGIINFTCQLFRFYIASYSQMVQETNRKARNLSKSSVFGIMQKPHFTLLPLFLLCYAIGVVVFWRKNTVKTYPNCDENKASLIPLANACDYVTN